MIDSNLTLTISNTFQVETESHDLVAGWILTIMLKLGGHKEFLGTHSMSHDDIIDFFGLTAYKEDYDKNDRSEILKAFEVFGMRKRQSNKGWINRILESNPIPTIWITNNIRSMDDAIVRRFDMVIEVPIPPKSKRKEIIEHYSESLINQESVKKIAENEHVAPAVISRATKVIEAIKDEMNDISGSYELLIENTLKAQGFGGIGKKMEGELPDTYDPTYVNTSMDLKELLDGIRTSESARLCLYGVPGTGKSAFGKWIARELDKPFLLKKGSDLISMFVGGTAKNIARARN